MKNNETLKPVMQEWLMDNKRLQIGQRTFEQFKRLAELHIYPALGDISLSQITKDTIEYFLNETLYREKNLAFATARKCKYILNGFFNYCVKENLITENPVTNAAITLNEKDKIRKPLTDEDFNRVIQAVSVHRFWKHFCLQISRLHKVPRKAMLLTGINLLFCVFLWFSYFLLVSS